MTTYRRRLSDGYGVLTVRESVDADRGEVTYRVHAPRVSGAFVAVPDWTAARDRLPLPNGLDLRLGTGWDHTSNDQRQERPCVNGITLTGTMCLDPVEWLGRSGPWHRFHRATGRWTYAPVPDRTNRLALAVAVQVLILWTSRPDRASLAHTRARIKAASRLAQLRHGPIQAAQAQIASLQAELADHQRLAAELETLAAEHEAITAAWKEQ